MEPRYGAGRAALLDAAIRVVAQAGLRGLTLRSVAAEAGVSHGLVRHHFGSRGALVEETLARSVEVAIAESAIEPGSGRIKDISPGLGSTVEDVREMLAFQYELLLEARRQPELMPHVVRMYDEYIAAIQRELERAGFPADPMIGRVFFAALDGLALQQVVFGHSERTRAGVALVQELFAVYLDSLGRA